MTRQATKQSRNLPSAVRRELKKKRIALNQPVSRQEYYLDLPDVWTVDSKTGIGKWMKAQLKLNPEEYFNLITAKLAEVRKDKVVNHLSKNGGFIYSYRLIVARLTDVFRNKCNIWQHQGTQSVTIQFLREYQDIVEPKVAQALASFLGKMIKYKALYA